MYAKALGLYGAAVAAWWPVIVAGVGAVVVASNERVREAVARVPRVRLAVMAVVIGGGVACAWQMLWFADDAFISLHYARNWVEGNGLVYNPGERVEGYTNFLWLAMIAACGWVGIDMPLATVALNLASYVGLVVVVHRTVRRLRDEVVVSFAAVMTALSYPIVSFATGGLETVFCALLVVAAAKAAHEGRTLWAGVWGILATMAHPDHALFYVAIGAVLLVRVRWQGWRELVKYAAPFVLIYVPYFALRWSYYGDPLPNTFYAKSGGGAYWGQGLRYLFVSLLVAGVAGVLPALVVGAWRGRKTVFGQIVLVAVPLYLLYVVRLGGDFMIGRLIVSVLPLMFVMAEVGARSSRVMLLAAPFVLACLPTTIFRAEQPRWHLADERTFWRVDELYPMTLEGWTARRAEVLRKYFGEGGITYAVYEIGYMAWRTRFRIVDLHGLIDRELAKMPLEKRGRPGHEREASREHVIAKGAVLSARPFYDPPHDQLATLVLDGELYHLAQFREELLARVRGKPGVKLVEMGAYLDEYVKRAKEIGEEQFRADLKFFDEYYFSVARDDARRAALLAAR